MSYKIIDVHVHAWPEKIASRAREELENVFGTKLVGEPTVDTLLKFMDKNSIDMSFICAVAVKPEQVTSINNWLFDIKNDRLGVMCALHPLFSGWRDEILRIKDKGNGIKFQPEFQGFCVDDDKMFYIYEEIEKNDLPVIFHCGEELSGTMLVRSSPQRISRVIDKFPHMKVIAAHFGGFRMWDEVKKHLLGKDVYMDTSFFFDYLPRDEVVSFLGTHPVDRIVFGTDFPLIDQKKDIDALKNIDIPSDLKEKIFFRNASSLMNIQTFIYFYRKETVFY